MAVISFLAGLLCLVIFVLWIVGLINPKFLRNPKNPDQVFTRRQILWSGLGSFIVVGMIGSLASPKTENEGEVQKNVPDSAVSVTSDDQAIVFEPAPIAKVDYKIVSDDSIANITRKVNVELVERINRMQLEQLAHDIKNADKNTYERTLILYRIAGEKSVAAWATTHFDPDLKIKFIGLDADSYHKLLNSDRPIDGELVGEWYANNGFEHVVVIYKKNGKYFENGYFADGSTSPEPRLLDFKHGKFSYADSDENWHFNVNKAGDLEFWGENGNSTTAKKL